MKVWDLVYTTTKAIAKAQRSQIDIQVECLIVMSYFILRSLLWIDLVGMVMIMPRSKYIVISNIILFGDDKLPQTQLVEVAV